MKKLAGAIKEKDQVVQFVRQGQNDLVDWIRRRFRALGHDIDTADAQYLIFLCGDLMNGLISEIGKIGAYAKAAPGHPPGHRRRGYPGDRRGGLSDDRRPHPRKIWTRPSPSWATSSASSRPPIMILAVLGKHFRQLYTARVALESGQGEPVAHGPVGDALVLSGGEALGGGPPPRAGLVQKRPCVGAPRPTWP